MREQHHQRNNTHEKGHQKKMRGKEDTGKAGPGAGNAHDREERRRRTRAVLDKRVPVERGSRSVVRERRATGKKKV